MDRLIIGTRGSALALYQAHLVQQHLGQAGQIEVIRTSGDRFQDVALGDKGGVGFFTTEIEEALRAGRIDLAVHSLKDLPVALAEGMVLAAVLERAEPGDVLLVHPDAVTDSAFPVREGARVGTGAMRRQALLCRYRPDLRPELIRGNVPTRVRKALSGGYDAIVLARAGLVRLGFDPHPLVCFDLNPAAWIGAAGQACIAVEARAGDQRVASRVRGLDHPPSRTCAAIERELLLASGGGCQSAFGAWAHLEPDGAHVHVAMPAADGALHLCHRVAPTLEQARAEAEEWIHADAPTDLPTEDAGWLCRPAHAWS